MKQKKENKFKRKSTNLNNFKIIEKKGVGIGQVFMFIIAAVTFALIMIFGYKAVVQFIDKGEQVEFVQFKSELENSIKKIYTEYGSRSIEDFHLPAKYEQICFVNLDAQATPEQIEELCVFDQGACLDLKEAQEVIASGKSGYESASKNVYLKPAAQYPIKVYKISIGDNLPYLCPKIVKGRFSLVLEGKGDHTEISASN